MKIIQLKYFVGVFEARSFLAASREMNVAQPALSRQISELEAELGVKLLSRNRTGTEPTEAGSEFYQRAHAILEQIESARDYLQNSGSKLSGEVSVGIMMSAVSLLGPKLVQKMAELYPDIKISVSEGLGFHTGDVVNSGQIDIGVMPNAHVLTRAKYFPVLKENLYLVKKRQGTKRQLGEISQKDAFNQKLILPCRNVDLRRHIEQLAISQNVTLTAFTEQQSWSTIRGLVGFNLGATIISWSAINSLWENDKIDAYRITGINSPRIISLVIPSSRPLSKTTQATYEVLKELIRTEVVEDRWRGDLLEAKT